MKTIPLTITTKTVIYLGINLAKEVKEQNTENYKTLIKEMKEEINNRKIPCVQGLKELTFSQSIYFKDSTQYLLSLMTPFTEIEKIILKLV